MSSGLSAQQIAQRRRQKILARAKKQQQSLYKQQQPNINNINSQTIQQNNQQSSFITQQTNKINENQQQTENNKSNKVNKENKQYYQQQQPNQDVFARFRSLQLKDQRQVHYDYIKMLILMSKLLGCIIVLLSLWFYYLLNNYHVKYLNKQINQSVWQIANEKLLSECDLMFFSCLGIIVFVYYLIKLNKNNNKNNNMLKNKSTDKAITILQIINQVLQYKVVLKAVFGYVATIMLAQLVLNYVIYLLGYQHTFYKNIFHPQNISQFEKQIL